MIRYDELGSSIPRMLKRTRSSYEPAMYFDSGLPSDASSEADGEGHLVLAARGDAHLAINSIRGCLLDS